MFKIKNLMLLLTLSIFLSANLSAQKSKKDPVLFTVAGSPVHVSEFEYIYSKTNGEKADFSKASLEEYLDLYTKFKLKVQRAKDMKLDTIPSLQRELEGYRRQLADSYLMDRSVLDQLSEEAYARIQYDLDISHILRTVRPNASPQDTMEAYQLLVEVKRRINNGENFEDLAKQFSNDPSAKNNGGHIGFVTALFPKGLYNLETAAYAAKTGEVLGPIRTEAGYHLLKVNDRRPARGEMEIAHILVRDKDGQPGAAKKEIDRLYDLLNKGTDFNKMAAQFSEDKRTSQAKGYIGFIKINRYEKSFEDAAFALTEDGQLSKPVQSSAGWHIIKRISKKTIQPYDIEKSRLNRLIKKDTRYEAAKLALLAQIKKDNNFKVEDAKLKKFIEMQNDTFLTFRWKAPQYAKDEVLFSLGKKYTVGMNDFMDYLKRSSRKRLRFSKKEGVAKAVNTLFDDFVNEHLIKFEESHLEEKYPDFRNLMREYEEGILLFEATKREVWDKASKDSTGLAQFFENNVKGKYRWGMRAETTVFNIPAKYKDRSQEIWEMAKTNEADVVKEAFNKDDILLSTNSQVYEKLRTNPIKDIKWEVGAITDIITEKSGNMVFYKIEKIIPPSEKKLSEARGYIVADYQDYLEKQWVEDLQKTYDLDINKREFSKLIKK